MGADSKSRSKSSVTTWWDAIRPNWLPAHLFTRRKIIIAISIVSVFSAAITNAYFYFISDAPKEMVNMVVPEGPTLSNEEVEVVEELLENIDASKKAAEARHNLVLHIEGEGQPTYDPKHAPWQLKSKAFQEDDYACVVRKTYDHGRLSIQAHQVLPSRSKVFQLMYRLIIQSDEIPDSTGLVIVHLKFNNGEATHTGFQWHGKVAIDFPKSTRDKLVLAKYVRVEIIPNRTLPQEINQFAPTKIKKRFLLDDTKKSIPAVEACATVKEPPLDDHWYAVRSSD